MTSPITPASFTPISNLACMAAGLCTPVVFFVKNDRRVHMCDTDHSPKQVRNILLAKVQKTVLRLCPTKKRNKRGDIVLPGIRLTPREKGVEIEAVPLTFVEGQGFVPEEGATPRRRLCPYHN